MGPPMDSPVPRVVLWVTALPAYSRRASAVARLYLSWSLSANHRVPADAVTSASPGWSTQVTVAPTLRVTHLEYRVTRVTGTVGRARRPGEGADGALTATG